MDPVEDTKEKVLPWLNATETNSKQISLGPCMCGDAHLWKKFPEQKPGSLHRLADSQGRQLHVGTCLSKQVAS